MFFIPPSILIVLTVWHHFYDQFYRPATAFCFVDISGPPQIKNWVTILEIDKCPVWYLKYNNIKSKLTIYREVDKEEIFDAYRRK